MKYIEKNTCRISGEPLIELFSLGNHDEINTLLNNLISGKIELKNYLEGGTKIYR
mgnify:CR=1 FL=1